MTIEIELDTKRPFQPATFAITGCTNDLLITIHEALHVQRKEYLDNLREVNLLDRMLYSEILKQPGRKFIKDDFVEGTLKENGGTEDNVVGMQYDASEDMLFLAEEIRKISELMFRIRTEKDVF